MKFCKYQALGNDFILIDNRQKTFDLQPEYISFLCNRHFGVGADGLMLVENCDDADFKMQFFNSDGNASTMCGNGSRCIVAFARKLGIFENETIFKSGAGMHSAKILSENGNVFDIKVKITDVNKIVRGDGYWFINTGVPHCVIFTDSINDVDVIGEGKTWRHSPLFPEGANVNFVEICDNEKLKLATFERGVEDETLACGTGATASAIAVFDKLRNNVTSYEIHAKGGKLKISFDTDKMQKDSFVNIWLQGAATLVFEGII
ncbi:MAG: diaminopimelate epimerase [Prevotellaceae bacterium]|jgi:diaminopimelate epimerase|nr:diaminopimelate epimerase [Prevotellaceae bacterium]